MNPNGSTNVPSVTSLTSWLIDWITRELAMDRREVHPGQTFLSYGMDSVQAMSMVGDLEATFSRRLPPTLAWDYPTIDALAEHLSDRLAIAAASTPEAARSQATPARSPAEIERLLAGLDQIGDQKVDRLLAKYLNESP
jgi:acyl carrier protein